MTELEYVLEKFHKIFQPFQGKRILIHGMRNYAQAIIERFDPLYHFVGISGMEECEEQKVFGKDYFSNDQIGSLCPELIILTERVKYEEEVFLALRSLCEEKGILLFNMYGVDEIQSHLEYETTGYISIRQWKEQIQPYDIIIFELLNGFSTDIEISGTFRPRMQMLRLIQYMRDDGKQFFFSLRKSYSKEKQIELLEESGIFSSQKELEDSLIIREGEDLSLRRFAESHADKKICYLGWGLTNEYILPRYYGIQSFRISDQLHDFTLGTEELVNANRHDSCLQFNDIEIVKGLIKEADVVSFDLFETLLVRKVLYPEDIFVIWGRKVLERFPFLPKNLEEYRIKAEKECAGDSIDLIYQKLADKLEIDQHTAEQLLDLEVETEKQFLALRIQVAQLLQFACEQGKEVVICSDMYYSEEILREFLENFYIKGYKKIYVSCDYHKGKGNGLFEEILKDYDNKKILHIGNDLEADVWSAENTGIEAYFIQSPLASAKGSWLRAAIKHSETFAERCLLGLIIYKLFSDPFNDQNSINWQIKKYAMSACAPVILGYLIWLIMKTKQHGFNGILFPSRDGFLVKDIFTQLADKSKQGSELPKPFYFYTSRHAAFLSCMDDPSNWELALPVGKELHLSPIMILRNIFDLSEKQTIDSENDNDCVALLREKLPLIRKKAEKERKNYLQYLKNSGLDQKGSYVFSDFFSAGTTQFFLEQFAPFRLAGYYFGRHFGKVTEETTNHLPGDCYFNATHLEIRERYMEMEHMMTSPEPSLKCFDEQGNPVFEKEVRSIETINEIKQIQAEVLDFCKEYIDLFYSENAEIRADFAELLFCGEGSYGFMRESYDDWGQYPITERKGEK